MKVGIFFFLFLVSFYSPAQQTFEQKIRRISREIEAITDDEKKALRLEIQHVEEQLKNKQLSPQQAEIEIQKLTEIRKNLIEKRVEAEQIKLTQVIKDKVNQKIITTDFSLQIKDKLTILIKKDSIHKYRHHHNRTVTQLVIAFGLNNALQRQQSLENSEFKLWSSHFWEFGISARTQLTKLHSPYYFKYGISLIYNNLKPKNNQYFVSDLSDTYLTKYATVLDNSRFRNVQIVIPLFFEYNSQYKQKGGFRIGLGGYAGLNTSTRQYLNYKTSQKEVEVIEISDFNTRNFIYGISGFVGYKQISFYTKYDLNTVFKEHSYPINNISFGIRWDIF